jgi:hypothetical protein
MVVKLTCVNLSERRVTSIRIFGSPYNEWESADLVRVIQSRRVVCVSGVLAEVQRISELCMCKGFDNTDDQDNDDQLSTLGNTMPFHLY